MLPFRMYSFVWRPIALWKEDWHGEGPPICTVLQNYRGTIVIDERYKIELLFGGLDNDAEPWKESAEDHRVEMCCEV